MKNCIRALASSSVLHQQLPLSLYLSFYRPHALYKLVVVLSGSLVLVVLSPQSFLSFLYLLFYLFYFGVSTGATRDNTCDHIPAKKSVALPIVRQSTTDIYMTEFAQNSHLCQVANICKARKHFFAAVPLFIFSRFLSDTLVFCDVLFIITLLWFAILLHSFLLPFCYICIFLSRYRNCLLQSRLSIFRNLPANYLTFSCISVHCVCPHHSQHLPPHTPTRSKCCR